MEERQAMQMFLVLKESVADVRNSSKDRQGAYHRVDNMENKCRKDIQITAFTSE